MKTIKKEYVIGLGLGVPFCLVGDRPKVRLLQYHTLSQKKYKRQKENKMNTLNFISSKKEHVKL